MKKTLAIVLLACFAMNVSAAKKKAPAKDANKPVFTIIKENPITSVKDQNRSGTCWDYSTLSFFEAEICLMEDARIEFALVSTSFAIVMVP